MPIPANPIRIAMWSGPRNISTAMMRSWGGRADTIVVDEPFYAYYLKATGKKHPGPEEIIAHGETDWQKVVEKCGRGVGMPRRSRAKAGVPTNKRIFYQKQMTHHLLPEVDRTWLGEVMNCFLIRNPRDVILSYIRKNPDPGLDDLGFVQQIEIFDFVRERTNSVPSVIDAKDVLKDPERILRLLCNAIGVEFDPAMLSWPPGFRESDGVWAKYWYSDLAKSTSFQPYQPKAGVIPNHLNEIYERCRECYEQLYEYRLR